MNKIIIVFFVLIISSISYAEKVELEKTDYLTLIISNYVHGFKEFETSVTSVDSHSRIPQQSQEVLPFTFLQKNSRKDYSSRLFCT
jgi:hypothetical protein